MAEQKQDDQHEHTFSNYVRIRDVVQKTCQRRWTIGKSVERGSGISVLPARHDGDDDDDIWKCREIAGSIYMRCALKTTSWSSAQVGGSLWTVTRDMEERVVSSSRDSGGSRLEFTLHGWRGSKVKERSQNNTRTHLWTSPVPWILCFFLQGGTIKLSPWKDDMIPFLFNENWFSFFVADHLLVGQLWTNPKSDRSLLSCLKVTQCSTSEIGDAPLYNSYSLPIQVMTTGPLPAPSKCKSGLPWITGTCPGWWKQSFQLQLWSLVWFQVRGHIMQPHIFEVGLKVNTKVYLDVLKSVVILLVQSGGRWQTLGVAAGLGAGPQVPRDPGLASEGVLRLCTLLPLAPPHLPWPEPAGLLRLVIRREHHQYDLPQHQSQPDHRHSLSIR